MPLILALLISGTVEAKKKKYPNGDYYEGKWKKGNPHGFGTMIYSNGDTYTGYWVYGIKEGQGSMTYKDDDFLLKYVGEWVSNKPNGKGIMTYKNGDIYEGFWNHGLHEGQGIMTFKNHWKYVKYDGEWKIGKQNGKGKIIYKNGDIYEGNWNMGEIFGEGTLTYANGDVFSGNWNGNERKGNLIMKNGNWYNGEWRNESFYNGECFINTEGQFFEGEIKNGRFYNGKVKIDKDTNFYDGAWENGNFIGNCKITNFNDTISSFTGNIFKDGSMNGTIEYMNGQNYSGEISPKYIPNGNGKLYRTIDNYCSYEIEGLWKNGELMKLNEGNVTIEPIIMNRPYNKEILSNKQVIPLEMVDNKLIYSGNSILNRYNRITDYIRNTTDSIIDSTKEKYISGCLKRIRTEDYKLCRNDRGTQGIAFLYRFDDAEYHIDPFTNNFHGKFHLWNGRYHDSFRNDIFSVQGQYKHGKKEGEWIYERRDYNGALTCRLIINYRNNLKSGLATLERIENNGSKAIIKAYYDKDHWNNKGTSYYSYIYHVKTVGIPLIYVEEVISTKENRITFDNDGKFHGNIFMKFNDIELKGEFNHGELIKMEKINVKKNVTLTPINGKEEFSKIWELVLPGTYNIFSYNKYFRFDDDPLIGLTLIDLTSEGKDFQESITEKIKDTKY